MARNIEKGAKFCLEKCPLCVKGREKVKGLLYGFLKIEARFCLLYRDYENITGCRRTKSLPKERTLKTFDLSMSLLK